MKKVLLIIIAVVLLIVLGGAFWVKNTYESDLKAVSSSSEKVNFSVEKGMTTDEIAKSLKEKGLIKSDLIFRYYMRINKNIGSIQAGEYLLDKNQSLEDIVRVLTGGKVATDLVTILPAKNLDLIKKSLIKSGYTENEVNSALNPNQYSAHPALVGKPAGATLEGYLYPETFQKTSETKLQDIIKLSLDEMNKRLTADVKKGFADQGLSVYQGITLASIVENESATANDRAKVASVFLNRLKIKMRLESNATDDYSSNNPTYDTYKIDGLPPGPISNVSGSSLEAVAHPAQTDYLFFVTADDHKTTYFSKTVEEHNALVRQYCKLNCAPH